MAKTRKTITISIKEANWNKLKENKIRVSTLINELLDEYLQSK